MKKILAVLLSLMLLLPAVSLGEAAEVVDTYPVEFDDFTLYVTSYDIIQKAPTKEEGQLLFLLYPNYDETAVVFNNINGTWSSENTLADLPEFDVNKFAQEQADFVAAQLTASGITASNSELHYAQKDDNGVIVLAYSADVDYTGAGIDLVTTLYQAQYYKCMGEKGTYVFTVTAYHPDDLKELFSYLETIEFKQ